MSDARSTGFPQGGADLISGRSTYKYPYLGKYLPLSIKPDAKSALLVAVGAGVLADLYAKRGVCIDTADIGHFLLWMAKRVFISSLPHPEAIDDARYFIAHPSSYVMSL